MIKDINYIIKDKNNPIKDNQMHGQEMEHMAI